MGANMNSPGPQNEILVQQQYDAMTKRIKELENCNENFQRRIGAVSESLLVSIFSNFYQECFWLEKSEKFTVKFLNHFLHIFTLFHNIFSK